MTPQPATLPDLAFRPLTAERWSDFEELLGEHGANDGCWCMWWRLTQAQFARQLGDENRWAMKAIVDSGEIPGLIAYSNGQPVGWCSVGPRESFPALNRSRSLRRIDRQRVWSIVCFYVPGPFRGRGLMEALLRAAIDYAKDQGAQIVEGYPVEPSAATPVASAYTGIAEVFRAVGFVEALRRTADQPIMRYVVDQRSQLR